MYEIYTVMPNDTLEIIATKYNVDPAFLYKLNNFNPSTILTSGTNIIVPNYKNQYFDYYTIQKGDSLYSIANQYQTSATTLAELNGLNINDYIYPNQTIMVPKKEVGIYITKENDTINSLTNKTNQPLNVLLNNNPAIYLLPDQIIAYKQ
ncbi:MAG: LysM peptidoglycan-binding domain-containing protein [bacterium]|nr:LysM peptidoglycan-binding domain-containing protein [bacterium]